MGMFKDMKGAMSGAGDAAANAQSMAAAAQQNAAGAEAYAASFSAGIAEGSYDPNDPGFAPIEGVDLDGYAKAVAAMAKSGTTDEAEAIKVAEGAGIPAGKWQAVSDGWVERMRTNRAVMNRYGTIYSQYS